MFANAIGMAGGWLDATSGTCFALWSTVLSPTILIPASLVAVLGGTWMALTKSGRKQFIRLFFYHPDSSRRKSEMRSFYLAIVLGLILCACIGLALYVLNKTQRL